MFLKLGFIRNRVLPFLILFIILSQSISAQNSRVSGRIIDHANGEALIGCNVMIEGTIIGAAADIDGHYTIPSVPYGRYNLIFSIIGYSKR